MISFLLQSCLTGPSFLFFFSSEGPKQGLKRKNSRTDCVLFSFHESVFLRERMAFGPNLRLIRSLFRNRSLKWKEKAWAVKKKRKRKLSDRSRFSFLFLFYVIDHEESFHSFLFFSLRSPQRSAQAKLPFFFSFIRLAQKK